MNTKIWHRIKETVQGLHSTLYDAPVREAALHLIEMDEESGDPVPLLGDILVSGDEWAALRVLDLLAEIKDARTIPALAKALDYATFQQPYDAELDKLRKTDSRGAIAMAEHAGGDIEQIRLGCIFALGEIAHPDAIPALSAVLSESLLRPQAIQALEKIGTPEALKAIESYRH